MKGTLLFTASMFTVGAVGWLLYDPSSPEPGRGEAGPSLSLASPAANAKASHEPAVMVIVVRTPGLLEALREKAPPGRVLLSRSDAVALIDGRIFAKGVEAASAPISELGWADRPLEIVDAGQFAASARRESLPGGSGPPSLAQKETLSLDEASQLLQQMMHQP